MTPSAEHFDAWYAGMAGSAGHASIQQGALGLPAHVESTSLLPWTGVDDVVSALALSPDDTLIDLACGRGGYGLEIAQRTRAALLGVDFSAVAIGRARELAAASFAGVDARFDVGELTACGLPDAAAAGLMCVDAMQFAEPYPDGFAECRRVLAAGGRLVVTGWQAHDPDDEGVPRRMRLDLAATAVEAGFTDVRSQHMAVWRGFERAMWQQAAALEPGDDPALQSMHAEGTRTLPWLERTARVLLTARRPA